MKKIVFVCTANICRSPMAEKLFEKHLFDHGQAGIWQVSSLGTWATDGFSADKNAIEVVKEWQMDLSNHRSRNINEGNFLPNDLVLVMEAKHKEALQYEFPKKAQNIFLLSEMVGQTFEIPDPYRKSIHEFRKVANQINDILITGWDRIIGYN